MRWRTSALAAALLALGAVAAVPQQVSQVVNSIVATSCTNQFVRAVSANGTGTCAAVAVADLALTTGTGSVVLSSSPEFTGTMLAATISASGGSSAAAFVLVGDQSLWWGFPYVTNSFHIGYDTGLAAVHIGKYGSASSFTVNPTSGAVTFPIIGTTASAANAFLDSGASNNLLRSTSSLLYKRDFKPVNDNEARDIIMALRPGAYNSLAPADDPNRRFFGLGAEDVARVSESLVHFMDGKPDGVMYDRVGVLTLAVVQEQDRRMAALEARLAAAEQALEQARAGESRLIRPIGGTAGNSSYFNGNVGVSGTSSTGGSVVASLPTCDTAARGSRYYVTDALTPSFLVVIVGGGAVITPVFCNGTNWVGA